MPGPKAIRVLPARQGRPVRRVHRGRQARMEKTGCRPRRNSAWSVLRPRTAYHGRQCAVSTKSWLVRLVCRERVRWNRRPRRSATLGRPAILVRANPISRRQSCCVQSGMRNDFSRQVQVVEKPRSRNPAYGRIRPGETTTRCGGRRRPTGWRSTDGIRGRRCEQELRTVTLRLQEPSRRSMASSHASSRGWRRLRARIAFSTLSERVLMDRKITKLRSKTVAANPAPARSPCSSRC
jgi:hypothetical protein